MSPVPIGLLIPLPQLGKIIVVVMRLLTPHVKRSVLSIVPFVVISMSGVVVTATVLLFLSLGVAVIALVAAIALSLDCRWNCEGAYEGRPTEA